MGGNLFQNWNQNGDANTWRSAPKRKLRKCVFEQQYNVFARFLMSGGWKIEEKWKDFEGNFSEDFKMVLESIFIGIWVDFRAKLDTTLRENRITN